MKPEYVYSFWSRSAVIVSRMANRLNAQIERMEIDGIPYFRCFYVVKGGVK